MTGTKRKTGNDGAAMTKRKKVGNEKASAESGGKLRSSVSAKAAAGVTGKRTDKKKQTALKKVPDRSTAVSKKQASVKKVKGVQSAATGKKKPGSAALVQEVVTIWEDLRPRQASAEVKQKLVGDILKLGKGKIKELAVKSKSSRVLQALLKYGTIEQQQKIWNECKDHIVDISMSVYGNHVIRKFISIASREQLAGIQRACKGKVVKLFKHPCGCAVIADLYEELPSAEQNSLVAEFYSRETALLGAKASTAALKSLVDAWPSMDGTERRATMQRLIVALQPIIEKAYVDAPAIHRLVSEYMRLAPADMLQDTVDSLIGEAVLRMVHTHEGCRVGCMVAAYSTPKQRKKLVKSMKGHVLKMCVDEFAYIVLIKTLAVTDDTEMVRKAIVAELQSQLEDILASQSGIKVVLSLVSDEQKHLPPHARSLLATPERTITVAVEEEPEGEQGEEKVGEGEQGEGEKGEGDGTGEEEKEKPTEVRVLGLSKKEPSTRRKELLSTGKASLSNTLVEHCIQHAAELLCTQHGGEVLECLACGRGVGAWLWDLSGDSIRELHAAVAAAMSENSAAGLQSAATGGHASGGGDAQVGGAEAEGDDDDSEDGKAATDDDKPATKPSKKQKTAVKVVKEVQEAVADNFFATRAVKRMVASAHGPSGESFLRTLWSAAFKGKVAKLKATHACKVIAALAQCPVAGVAKEVRVELKGALEGQNVDRFLETFAKPTKAGR